MVFKIKKRKYEKSNMPPKNIPELRIFNNDNRYITTYYSESENENNLVLAKVEFIGCNERTRLYSWEGKYWSFRKHIIP